MFCERFHDVLPWGFFGFYTIVPIFQSQIFQFLSLMLAFSLFTSKHLMLIYLRFFMKQQHTLKRSTAIQKVCLYELFIMITALPYFYHIYHTIFFTNT